MWLINKIYKGLDFSRKQIYEFKDIPGLTEAGWNEEDYKNSIEDDKTFEQHWEYIVEKLKKHKSSWPFMKPVNPEDVNDYYDVIKDPIDIETITNRISKGYYKNTTQFEDDVMRMFTNWKQYNDKDSIYWLLANSLQEYITPFLKKMKDKHSNQDA